MAFPHLVDRITIGDPLAWFLGAADGGVTAYADTVKVARPLYRTEVPFQPSRQGRVRTHWSSARTPRKSSSLTAEEDS